MSKAWSNKQEQEVLYFRQEKQLGIIGFKNIRNSPEMERGSSVIVEQRLQINKYHKM